MLVAQGVRASEYFLGKKYDKDVTEKTYKKVLCDKKNIVLIGMPSCGKTTVGKILAEKLGRDLIDTDDSVCELAGMDIPTIFEKRGENVFRDVESLATDRASAEYGKVISTGGGVILRRNNVTSLRENGRIYFIDRPLAKLLPTGDRPTASSIEAIANLYAERYDKYVKCADVTVNGDADPEEIANTILNDFLKG